MKTLPFDPTTIDAVLFDMDGTMVDTDNADVSKWAARLAHLYDDRDRAAAVARKLVMAKETPGNFVFGLLDRVGLDGVAVRVALALTGGGGEAKVPAIQGVPGLVDALAERYKLGVVSTRTEAEQARMLGDIHIRDYFGAFVGRDSTWRIKPHPQPVLKACATLKVQPGRVVMVGDTTVDVRSARQAGAYSVAVLCGYGERDELERAGAHLILDTTAQLHDLLV
jgi:phosphoglycolate phosphatase